MNITGTTSVYWIAGAPVEQVRAPELFNAVFQKLGIDAVLVPVSVAVADFAGLVKASLRVDNFKGFWLAIPHKSTVMPILGECSAAGWAAGAVNAVKMKADGSLQGDAFDGHGFLGLLDHFGIAYQGQSVLIVGAGGGGAAIAVGLMENGVGTIALFDVDVMRAQVLALRIGELCGRAPVVQPHLDTRGFDVVVHATPLGLNTADPLPFDVAELGGGTAVVDILMKNQPTPLLQAARARGLRAEPGFEMLIQQAPNYLDFFGHHDAADAVRANRGGLTDELRRLIYPAGWVH